MIIVSGAAGFIGSCLVGALNSKGYNELVLVDDFSDTGKLKNLDGKKYLKKIHRDLFPQWLSSNHASCDFIFHLGARTDTTEFDKYIFNRLNLDYSKTIWDLCSSHSIPMVYASSAATYGSGEHGYKDDHSLLPALSPLNPYGESKHDFDKWVLNRQSSPPFWAGLKFFNVFGPNEYHKGRMASVVFHAFGQIKSLGNVKLFRSHNPHYDDGMQLRDFIYVKDVVKVLLFTMEEKIPPAIYNLGSGHARPFLHLANAVFHSLNKKPNIEFIDTPLDIRDKYQYFTEARMDKLRRAGYKSEFNSLEAAVHDYVNSYLLSGKYY